MPITTPARDLSLALGLAQQAAALSQQWSGAGGLNITTKADGSPVSSADLAVDHLISATLQRERPDDGVLSEESAERRGCSGRRWIIDPIDGTVPFLAGRPGWGNHIALEINSEVVVGVVTRPSDDIVLWAVAGEGAYLSTLHSPGDRRRRLAVSPIADAAEATVLVHGPEEELATVRRTGATAIPRTPHWLTEFLTGRADAVLLCGGQQWDYAPWAVLTREAGGAVRSPDGGSSITQHRLLCGNAALVDHLSPYVYRTIDEA